MTVLDTNVATPGPHNTEQAPWGTLCWLVSSAVPGAEQTVGVVTINPGQANPLHRHPNCEEVLYVMSGTCEHQIGELTVDLSPGTSICIPRGVAHRARATSAEPLKVLVTFSSPDRQVENIDGDGIA